MTRSLLLLVFFLFVLQSCSIPANCDPEDYDGSYVGFMNNCNILNTDEVNLVLEVRNGGLVGTYNGFEVKGGMNGCWAEVTAEISPFRSVDISVTDLLGIVSGTISEISLGDTTTCSITF